MAWLQKLSKRASSGSHCPQALTEHTGVQDVHQSRAPCTVSREEDSLFWQDPDALASRHYGRERYDIDEDFAMVDPSPVESAPKRRVRMAFDDACSSAECTIIQDGCSSGQRAIRTRRVHDLTHTWDGATGHLLRGSAAVQIDLTTGSEAHSHASQMPVHAPSIDCTDLYEVPASSGSGMSIEQRQLVAETPRSRGLQVGAAIDASAADVFLTSTHLPIMGSRSSLPSMQSDHEIALALQFEEGAAAAEEMSIARTARPLAFRPLWCLYAIEPCSHAVRCRACGEPVPRHVPRMLFQRPGHRKPHSAHVGCISMIEGLVRPVGTPSAAPPTAGGGVLWSDQLPHAERMAIGRQLDVLPVEPVGVQCFMWPPAPRPLSRRTELRQQLMLTERDFTAEDYEMLLELDSGGGSRSHRAQEDVVAKSTLLTRLPVSILTDATVATQCSICLDNMRAGAEVTTLPCMHTFHRKCIERWIMTPGPPRCPIDQVKVET